MRKSQNTTVRTVYQTKKGFNVRLEARLKNAQLIKARETLGLNAREAAEQMGLPYYSLLGY